MTLSKPSGGDWNLKNLTFGGFRLSQTDVQGRVVQSRDLEVEGVDDLHKACTSYLEAYDSVCFDFLEALHTKAGA